jgi:hypothetical protein
MFFVFVFKSNNKTAACKRETFFNGSSCRPELQKHAFVLKGPRKSGIVTNH